MAKFASANVLDNGPAYIKANCQRVVAIVSYTFGATYATVTGAGNILGEAAMAPADLVLSTVTNDRALTTAAKTDAEANAGGTPTHFAFLNDTGSEVLWVTEETSGQQVTVGNPIDFPSLVYTAKQPTA